ncbi:hypothetical protein [Candidatus Bodocaedibacter vickermanii]|uniref:Uncharacterized protein n=1 Tax=Candidatus Bodocaedibacter vickermanii TaxID=2741701 RepID=A0A7L9RU88_9PROT|nr:hypothetical protein CPBP_00961 [Candidatus Paracaedibacteraceae bacterium 'Lake Konstanz']
MIELFKTKFLISSTDLIENNIGLESVICLYEKGIINWTTLQNYFQSIVSDQAFKLEALESLFIKAFLMDEALVGRTTTLELCREIRCSADFKGGVRGAFHFLLRCLIKYDFFTFDFDPLNPYCSFEFYELIYTLLSIFESADKADELFVEYKTLNEMRFGRSREILDALMNI